MKKIGILFLIVSIAIFLVGCEGGGETQTGSPYIGGSQGVVANFEPMGIVEEGVNTVWTGEQFPVHVTIKNKGEESIPVSKLAVSLKGVDTTLFGINTISKNNTVALDGITEFNKLGGEETLRFTDAAKVLTPALTTPYYDADFYANVDYDYKTYAAVPKVCFKQNLRDETICEVSGSKEVYSSGAPIKVASVRQDPAGTDTVALTFDIENVGGGKVKKISDTAFDPRYDKIGFSFSETAPATSPDPNKVYWTCTSAGSTGEARLVDGKTSIRCKSGTLPTNTLYTKQVTLTLEYTYRSVIQQTLRVKKA